MTISLLTGCKMGITKELSPMEKIHKRYIGLDSYEATVRVVYVSNQGKNEYKMKHYYKRSGQYRIEIMEPQNLAGIVTIFDGEKVTQMNPNIEGKALVEIEKSPYREEILLGSFFKNYFQSQEVALEVGKMEEGEATVLETQVPNNNPMLAFERLWIGHEKWDPMYMILYDDKQEKRIVVKYDEFMYNKTLDDALFHIQ